MIPYIQGRIYKGIVYPHGETATEKVEEELTLFFYRREQILNFTHFTIFILVKQKPSVKQHTASFWTWEPLGSHISDSIPLFSNEDTMGKALRCLQFSSLH